MSELSETLGQLLDLFVDLLPTIARVWGIVFGVIFLLVLTIFFIVIREILGTSKRMRHAERIRRANGGWRDW